MTQPILMQKDGQFILKMVGAMFMKTAIQATQLMTKAEKQPAGVICAKTLTRKDPQETQGLQGQLNRQPAQVQAVLPPAHHPVPHPHPVRLQALPPAQAHRHLVHQAVPQVLLRAEETPRVANLFRQSIAMTQRQAICQATQDAKQELTILALVLAEIAKSARPDLEANAHTHARARPIVMKTNG